MGYNITIDCGTTNTRIFLFEEENILQRFSTEIGVRNTAIDGNNAKLKSAVKLGIEKVIDSQGISLDDIDVILAAGMITSNLGLYEIEHIYAPAKIDDFATAMKEKLLPEVCSKPIWFIPGLKNNIKEVNVTNFVNMDIMRGEEVEALYVSETLSDKLPALFVLPGSHTKFISINENKEILGCLTTLGGELIAAVSENTIVASSVENRFAERIDHEYLIKGYKEARKTRLSRTLFSIRILGQFTNTTQNQKANFLIGAILYEDIKAILSSGVIPISWNMNVIIVGKKILSDSFEFLLKYEEYFNNVVNYSDMRFDNMSGKGSLLVAKRKGLIK